MLASGKAMITGSCTLLREGLTSLVHPVNTDDAYKVTNQDSLPHFLKQGAHNT